MDAFKHCVVLRFFKGVLMKDEGKILIQQTENVQDRRQIRFAAMQQISALDAIIKIYVEEAK